jgi:hypothetical protein
MSAAGKIESAVAQPHQMAAVHDKAGLLEDDEYEYAMRMLHPTMRVRGADDFISQLRGTSSQFLAGRQHDGRRIRWYRSMILQELPQITDETTD